MKLSARYLCRRLSAAKPVDQSGDVVTQLSGIFRAGPGWRYVHHPPLRPIQYPLLCIPSKDMLGKFYFSISVFLSRFFFWQKLTCTTILRRTCGLWQVCSVASSATLAGRKFPDCVRRGTTGRFASHLSSFWVLTLSFLFSWITLLRALPY